MSFPLKLQSYFIHKLTIRYNHTMFNNKKYQILEITFKKM